MQGYLPTKYNDMQLQKQELYRGSAQSRRITPSNFETRPLHRTASIKLDLGCLCCHVDLFKVISVRRMRLLLDSPAKSSQCIWHVLASVFEDALQLASKRLFVFGKESDGLRSGVLAEDRSRSLL